MKKKTGKSAEKLLLFLLVMILVTALAAGLSGCSKNQESGNDIDQQEYLNEYVKVRWNAGRLVQYLEKETPYTELYKYVMTYMAEDQPIKDALKKAEETWLKFAALNWYAVQNDLAADSQQVTDYIETHIAAFRSSDEMEMYEEACALQNVNFDEWMYADWDTYQNVCTMDNVYASLENPEEEWNDFLKTVQKQFEASDEYLALQPKLDRCMELLASEHLLTAEQLLTEDIFLE